MVKKSKRAGHGAKGRGKKVKQEEALRVVVFQEGDVWVAQCLEYDIGAQAPSLNDLRSRFEATLAAERAESVERHGTPFAGIDPAPEMFKAMWDGCPGEYVPTPARNEIPFRMAMCA